MSKCIILTHGDLGSSLLATAAKIIGPVEDIIAISNEQKSLRDLVELLRKVLDEWNEPDVLIAVDFCGGSCWHAAQVVKKNHPETVLVSGVNLPMILAYLNKRDSFMLPELADYLSQSAVKGITVIKKTISQSDDDETQE